MRAAFYTGTLDIPFVFFYCLFRSAVPQLKKGYYTASNGMINVNEEQGRVQKEAEIVHFTVLLLHSDN
jgi:hypothetical protein